MTHVLYFGKARWASERPAGWRHSGFWSEGNWVDILTKHGGTQPRSMRLWNHHDEHIVKLKQIIDAADWQDTEAIYGVCN